MIAKGKILSIDLKGNTCVVRMPIFETAGNDEISAKATFSNTPGIYNGYKVGDVVYVGFENGTMDTPVVIGKLFLGSELEESSPRGTVNVETSAVAKKATLPFDSKLTNDIGKDNTIPNTAAPFSSLASISSKVSELDTKAIQMNRDFGNRFIQQITALNEQGEALSSKIEQTAKEITLDVSQAVGEISNTIATIDSAKFSDLKVGYTSLGGIRSTAGQNQYINLNYKLQPTDTLEITFKADSADDSTVEFGFSDITSKNAFYSQNGAFLYGNNSESVVVGNSIESVETKPTTASVKNAHIVKVYQKNNKTITTVDGIEAVNPSTTINGFTNNPTNGLDLYLFCLNQAGTAINFNDSLTIYSVKITSQDGTIIKALIPAEHNYNQIIDPETGIITNTKLEPVPAGLYDLASESENETDFFYKSINNNFEKVSIKTAVDELTTAGAAGANVVSAMLNITAENINAEVSKKINAADGTTGSERFGWELETDHWALYNQEWTTGELAKAKSVLWADKDGLYIKGTLDAEAGGHIGGFEIAESSLYNGDITSFDPEPSPGTTGIYIGPDGIRLGAEFSVDNAGTVTAKGFTVNLTPAQKVELTGPKGATGNTGPTGPIGATGAPGTSVTIKGSLASAVALPQSGTPGDGYLINGDLYVWSGTEWNNVGKIQGRSISSITNYYLASASNTGITHGTAGWTTTLAEAVENFGPSYPYLWNYEEIYDDTNALINKTDPAILSIYTKDGVGIAQLYEFYITTATSASPDATSFTKSPNIALGVADWQLNTPATPTSETMPYLWNCEVVEYTDGTTNTATPIIIGNSIKGDVGAAGIGITAYLTNDSHTVFTDNAGTVPPNGLNGAETTVVVNENGVDVSSSWNIAYSATGCTYTSSGKTLTITGLSADNAYVDLTLTKTYFTTIVKRFTISKVKTGDPSTRYWIETSDSAVYRDGTTFVPSSITFSAYKQVGNTTPELYTAGILTVGYLDSLGNYTDLGINVIPGKYTVSLAGTTYKAIRCTLKLANSTTIIDTETVPIIERGPQGTQGIPGPIGATGKASYIHIKYSPDGLEFSGNDGEDVADWLGVYITNDVPDPMDFDLYTWRNTKGAEGEKGIPGEAGADGLTSYLHIKYSDDGEQFTPAVEDKYSIGERPGNYIGQYTDFNEADSTTFADYSWVKIKGEKGNTGETGISIVPNLTNDFIAVPSDILGDVNSSFDWTEVSTQMQIFVNGQNDSSSWNFSISDWAGFTTSGMTGIIDITTGIFNFPNSSPTLEQDVDIATVTLLATHATFSQQEITFTISKLKQGNPITDLSLEASSYVVVVKDNTLSPETIDLKATLVNGTKNVTWTTDNSDAKDTNGELINNTIDLSKTLDTSTLNETNTKITITTKNTDGEDITDSCTIVFVSDGSDGKDGLSVILTNEAEVIPTDKDGKTLAAITFSTTVLAYLGTTKQTPAIGISSILSTLPANSLTSAIDATNSDKINFTLVNGTSLTAGKYTIDIPITVSGQTINKSINISVSKQGQPGTDAKDISLVASTYIVKATNKIPVIFTITPANLPSGSKIKWTLTGATFDDDDYDTDIPTKYTQELDDAISTGITIRAANYNTNFEVKAEVVGDPTLYDKCTITLVNDGVDGASAINVITPNIAELIPADKDGNIANGFSFTTDVMGYVGATQKDITLTLPDDNSEFTLTNTTPSGNLTKTVKFTARNTTLNGDSGAITFTVTVEGTPITKTISWSKSKTGATGEEGLPGADSTSYWLIPSANTIYNNGPNYTPNTLTFTAMSQTGTASAAIYTAGTFIVYKDAAALLTEDYTISNGVVSIAAAKFAGATTIKCELKISDILVDSESVSILKDGSNAKDISIVAETYSINKDTQTPGTINFTINSSNLIDAEDVIKWTFSSTNNVIQDSSWSVLSQSVANATTTGTTLTLSDWATLTGVIKVTVTYSPANLSDTCSIVVLTNGTDGAKGDTGDAAVNLVLSNEAETLTALVDGTFTQSPTIIESDIFGFNGTTAAWVKLTTVVDSSSYFTITKTNSTTTKLAAHIKAQIDSSSSNWNNLKNIDNGTITITANIYKTKTDFDNSTLNYAEITKTINWSKSKTGSPGQHGTSSSSYWLVASANTIYSNLAGTTFIPNRTLTFTAKKQEGTGSPETFTAAKFKVYRNDVLLNASNYTVNAGTVSMNAVIFTSDLTSFKCELYDTTETALFNSFSVPVVKQGDQANLNFTNVATALGITTTPNSKGIYSSGTDLLINATAIQSGVFTVADDDNIFFNASITNKEVQIGGFNVDQNSLTRGTLGQANSIYLSSALPGPTASIADSGTKAGWAFGLGSNFGVLSNGTAYAKGAHIAGTIIADAGSIGGWTIGANKISSAGGINLVSSSTSANNKIYIGAGTWKSDKFYVDGTGKFSLGDKLAWDGSNFNIGSWTINNNTLWYSSPLAMYNPIATQIRISVEDSAYFKTAWTPRAIDFYESASDGTLALNRYLYSYSATGMRIYDNLLRTASSEVLSITNDWIDVKNKGEMFSLHNQGALLITTTTYGSSSSDISINSAEQFRVASSNFIVPYYINPIDNGVARQKSSEFGLGNIPVLIYQGVGYCPIDRAANARYMVKTYTNGYVFCVLANSSYKGITTGLYPHANVTNATGMYIPVHGTLSNTAPPSYGSTSTIVTWNETTKSCTYSSGLTTTSTFKIYSQAGSTYKDSPAAQYIEVYRIA